MNKLDKTQEEQILLDDKNNITPLENPMVEATLQTLRQIIEDLYEGSYVDDITVKWLSHTPNPPRIRVFYTPTKIHKPTPFGRSIVAGNGGPAERRNIGSCRFNREENPPKGHIPNLLIRYYPVHKYPTRRGKKHSMQSIRHFVLGKQPCPHSIPQKIPLVILQENSFEFTEKI